MSEPFLTPTIKTFSELTIAHNERRIKIIAHTNAPSILISELNNNKIEFEMSNAFDLEKLSENSYIKSSLLKIVISFHFYNLFVNSNKM
jgi:hypothetical protein